jgi:hypothetical protein
MFHSKKEKRKTRKFLKKFKKKMLELGPKVPFEIRNLHNI